VSIALSSPRYNLVVWPPNALGSTCFLISGAIFYLSSPRRGWFPERRHDGWWEPALNLLGCVLFAVSAIAGLVVSSSGAMVSARTSDWTTSLGAACFLACALAALSLGQTLKAPRLRRLRAAVVRELEQLGATLAADVEMLGRVTERGFDHVKLAAQSDMSASSLVSKTGGQREGQP
jgi:hypothetical protein